MSPQLTLRVQVAPKVWLSFWSFPSFRNTGPLELSPCGCASFPKPSTRCTNFMVLYSSHYDGITYFPKIQWLQTKNKDLLSLTVTMVRNSETV